MKFKIEFDIDIHDFVGKNIHSEIDRILREVSIRTKDWDIPGSIKDANGKTIGKYELK
jgi:hypothetical protein